MAPGPWLTSPEACGESEGQIKGTPVSLKASHLPPEKADTYSSRCLSLQLPAKALLLTGAYLQHTLLGQVV